MMRVLTTGWNQVLSSEFDQPYWHTLSEFVASERAQFQVFPSPDHVFNALELTPFAKTQIVILGQDPYHEPVSDCLDIVRRRRF